MKYYTFLQDDSATVQDYTKFTVFPANEIKALQTYAVHTSEWGKLIENGEGNLYSFEAAEPIDLPFSMNLNYTDAKGADKLDDNNLSRAIEIMSQYENGDIINSGSHYEEDERGDWKEVESPWRAAAMNHSREQLIYILSSIAKTLGQVVRSSSWREDYRNGGHMEPQVLVTTPARMVKVPTKEAIELLGVDDWHSDYDNPWFKGGDPQQDAADWWKNPQEDIIKIAKIIDEDLI